MSARKVEVQRDQLLGSTATCSHTELKLRCQPVLEMFGFHIGLILYLCFTFLFGCEIIF